MSSQFRPLASGVAQYLVIVPGKMAGKGSVRSGANGAYTDQQTRDLLRWVRNCAKLCGATKPLRGPLEVSLTVYVEPPASWSVLKREQALGGELWPDVKPDLDNYVKLLQDGLKGLAWRDDCQVVRLLAEKRYGAEARTIISIASLEGARFDDDATRALR